MKLLNFIIGSTIAQFDPFMSKFILVFVTKPANLDSWGSYDVTDPMVIMTFEMPIYENVTC